MKRDDYTVLFNGTKNAPLGRLLFPPAAPEPVRVRWPVAPPPRPRTPREKRRDDAMGGPVHDAKDRIWQMLEFPRTARDIFEALGLPENATSSMMARGRKFGVLAYAGHRPNEARTPGVRQWSQLYVRAAAHAHVKTWPFLDTHMTRTQKRVVTP